MKKIKILTFLLSLLAILGYSQNFENTKKKLKNPVAGMYQPSYAIFGYPYSTIYKTSNTNYVENIRQKIVDTSYNKYFKNIYVSIYTNAQQAIDLSNKYEIGGEEKLGRGIGKSSYYAKHAAYVYLMGFNQYGRMLRGTGNQLDKDTLEVFRTKALKRLINLDYGVDKKKYIQWRSKELIQYLQAYDLLKTAGLQSYNLENV